MPYRCLNIGLKLNVKVDRRQARRAAARVAAGERWEFQKSMYGHITEVFDHERFRWYRQDLPVDGQGDLFEGYLPFKCDYCKQIVHEVSHVVYQSIYWFLVRPSQPTREWKRSVIDVKFSRCTACSHGPIPFPGGLIGYHMTELYENNRLIFRQDRRS